MADEKLKPASENPWYVLATIAGEQIGTNFDFHKQEKNRRYWNGWMGEHLSKEVKARLLEQENLEESDFSPLTAGEKEKIEETFANLGLDPPQWENEIDFRRIAFEKSLRFDQFLFPCETNFVEARFSRRVSFRQAVFMKTADFEEAIFEQNARFDRISFLDDVYFQKVQFLNVSYFSFTKFFHADFSKCVFSKKAHFGVSKFGGEAHFSSSTFSDAADFSGACFSSSAHFYKATFELGVDFTGGFFNGNLSFEEAIFGLKSSGEPNFTSRKFGGPTTFRSVRFLAEPPVFFEAELHKDTDFNNVKWPPDLVKKDRILDRRVSSYETLKNLMSVENRFHDEHLFLRKELRCRELKEGWSAAGMGSRLYRVISDYGWSVRTPASIIGGMMLVCWFVLMWQECMYGAVNEEVAKGGPVQCFGKAGILSFASIFGFLGIGRMFLKEEFEALSAVSQLFSGSLMVFGPLMLFFLILALRNRFRIK